MPQDSLLITETRKRLLHLRSLPTTSMRQREIESLERVLTAAPAMAKDRRAAAASPGRKSRERLLRELDEAEGPAPSTPRRKVEKADGHQRIILRKNVAADSGEGIKDGRTPELERKRLIGDIKSTMGVQHRGMS